MVLIHDRIIIIDICNFEMSYKTPEKSLKSNQIYSAVEFKCAEREVVAKARQGIFIL